MLANVVYDYTAILERIVFERVRNSKPSITIDGVFFRFQCEHFSKNFGDKNTQLISLSFVRFLFAMYVHHLGLYCILFRSF